MKDRLSCPPATLFAFPFHRPKLHATLSPGVKFRGVTSTAKKVSAKKARVLAVAVHLQTIIERYKSPFLSVPFPFTASLWQVLQPMSAFVVMRQRCLRVFTGSQVQAFGFAKIFLFPCGRAYLFAKKLTTLNPASLIADETKVTDPTD